MAYNIRKVLFGYLKISDINFPAIFVKFSATSPIIWFLSEQIIKAIKWMKFNMKPGAVLDVNHNMILLDYIGIGIFFPFSSLI